jgi:hypothetical protein
MARRTKAQIQREKVCDVAAQNACFGLQIPIMKLSEISKAAEAAYDAGKTPEEVAQAARQAAERVAA